MAICLKRRWFGWRENKLNIDNVSRKSLQLSTLSQLVNKWNFHNFEEIPLSTDNVRWNVNFPWFKFRGFSMNMKG